MIAVIDNYDSFTYNLVQLMGEMGEELYVLRNDRFSMQELAASKPRAVIVSPGPGTPQKAGLSMKVIDYFAGRVPVFGVCLGHQAIGSCYGADVIQAPLPVHGKASNVFHNGDSIFDGVQSPFPAGRYHSLMIKRETLPECLQVTAETSDGLVMGVRHKELPVYGVQFHPESVITPSGKRILKNFLRVVAS
ncbi:MAG: aminodeoxychorismate/anthranilate synthase component II [Dethiobacter sp.]|jgi:para-aminobenzoate synthetase component 2|nr:aminodeoxychorismate/anthranilate synthase component II [Dethiobacter sp.]